MEYISDEMRIEKALQDWATAERKREFKCSNYYGLEHKPTSEKEAFQNVLLRRKIKAMRKHIKQMEKAIIWRNMVIEDLIEDVIFER